MPVRIIPLPIIIPVTCVLPRIVFSGIVLIIGAGIRFVAVRIDVMAAFLGNRARSWMRQGTGSSFFAFTVAIRTQKIVAKQLMTGGRHVCPGIVKGLSSTRDYNGYARPSTFRVVSAHIPSISSQLHPNTREERLRADATGTNRSTKAQHATGEIISIALTAPVR